MYKTANYMKYRKVVNRFLSFYLFTLLFSLFACGGGDDGGGGSTPSGGSEYLNVRDVDIPGGNTTATLNIQASNNCDWTISWSDSWIRSINPNSGRGTQNATITVTVNPSSTTSRTATVNVSNTSGSIVRTVTITQAPNAESLSLSVASLNFTNAASSQTVTVTGNTQWSIVEDDEWVTCSPRSSSKESEVVTVSVKANTDESQRTKVITFKGVGGMTKQLEVRQDGRPTDFSVTPTNIAAEATASTVQFSIIGEARWSVKSNEGWATLSSVTGEGSKTIDVALTDNTTEAMRTAQITVSSSSKSETVTITQTAGARPSMGDISTSSVVSVGQSTATLSFAYTSMFPVTEYGVCYSTTNNSPDISAPHVSLSGNALQGTPTISITGLTPGTTYYVRAYATSAVGTQYSNAITFTTIGDWPGGGDNTPPGI